MQRILLPLFAFSLTESEPHRGRHRGTRLHLRRFPKQFSTPARANMGSDSRCLFPQSHRIRTSPWDASRHTVIRTLITPLGANMGSDSRCLFPQSHRIRTPPWDASRHTVIRTLITPLGANMGSDSRCTPSFSSQTSSAVGVFSCQISYNLISFLTISVKFCIIMEDFIRN